MFTGIIEDIGTVSKIARVRGNLVLTIESRLPLKVGASISVNGTCLTVVETRPGTFRVDVMRETIKSTGIDRLKVNNTVNLEPALSIGDRLGGHFVTGHVDEAGRIRSLRKTAGGTLMEVSGSPRNLIYLVKKGSVALDGVSLTVQDLTRRSFTVGLIPHTLNSTTLGKKKAGHFVNIEYDLLAKHLHRFFR